MTEQTTRICDGCGEAIDRFDSFLTLRLAQRRAPWLPVMDIVHFEWRDHHFHARGRGNMDCLAVYVLNNIGPETLAELTAEHQTSAS